jgi:MFS transporter, Spinster family, sphingosine-1-phosphate transporter
VIKNRTAILALLTGLNLLNYIDRYVVAAVLKAIKEPAALGGLGLSGLESGLLGTAFMLGYFATSPFFGGRADKGKRNGLIALGVAIWSVATFATGLTHTFGTMLCARVAVGIGEASYATLAPTIIDDITPPEFKNRALAIFYLAIPVGSALGYVLGGTILKYWGWRYAFFISGGPGLVLALSCLAIAEPERKLREVKAKALDGLRTVAKLPLFRRDVLGYCAYTAAIGAFAYWAPNYLADTYAPTLHVEVTGHLAHFVIVTQGTLTTASAAQYFGAVTVVGGAIGTIIGGRWSDRALRAVPDATAGLAWDAAPTKRGTNALLGVCSKSMIVAAPLVVLVFVMPSPIAFFAVALVAEIFLFLSTSPVNAIGLRAVPPELRASAMAGMIFAIHLFGDLWSPSVLGLLYDYLIPTVAMMAVPVVFAVSAYLWWPRAREAES